MKIIFNKRHSIELPSAARWSEAYSYVFVFDAAENVVASFPCRDGIKLVENDGKTITEFKPLERA